MRFSVASSVAAVALLAVVACAEVDRPEPRQVIPSDYKSHFVEVRNCRVSVEHGLEYVRIRTAPEHAAIYDSGPYPFPAGALVVKEQYGDARCTQPTGFTVMRKESGSGGGDGEWAFFRLDRRERTVEHGRPTTCVSCHESCETRDQMCAD